MTDAPRPRLEAARPPPAVGAGRGGVRDDHGGPQFRDCVRMVHLKRDFQALIDSPCTVRRRLGHDLMRPTKEMFALWQKVRDGTLSRRAFRRQMGPIRQRIEGYLLRGYFDARVSGFCKELWERREHLWTFVEIDGVEPTNNAAEQALRQAVVWRKLSFGTQSADGSRFVERMLTVVETCRRQKRDVFAWMI